MSLYKRNDSRFYWVTDLKIGNVFKTAHSTKTENEFQAQEYLAKLRNQYRYHLLLKCSQPQILNQFIRKLMGDTKWVPQQTKIIVDVDPLNLL